MSKKSELAAMMYLLKNHPKKFRIKRYTSEDNYVHTIQLDEYGNYGYCDEGFYLDWKKYHSVQFLIGIERE